MSMEKSTAASFIASAWLGEAKAIMDERAKQYDDEGSGERSMGAAVLAFNAITGGGLTTADGYLLLALLKMVRDNQRESPHMDSLVDLVAYSALYAEARCESL